MKRTEKIERKVLIPTEETRNSHGINYGELYQRACIKEEHVIELLHMGEQVVDIGNGMEHGHLFIVKGERELPDMKKRRALIKKVRRLGFLPGGRR
jgi:hypothetical protein